jgi:prefoldin subunit 5
MFAICLALCLIDTPESFASKQEKDAAMSSVASRIDPIARSIRENKEDLDSARRARIGSNETKDLGNRRYRHVSFRTAEKKSEAIAKYETTIKELEEKLKPLDAEIKALKRVPIKPKQPEKPND